MKQEAPHHEYDKNSICLIVIGMSGTGKTTLVNVRILFTKRINQHSSFVHTINLDPAVKIIPYTPFIDIR